MADKKLNEVTTVNSGTLSNVKNFLAVMNDGSIQQMSKEDMATVVGVLIGTATDSKNGLMPTSVYKNYCRELSTSSNSRKLWKITEANYDAPILLRIYGRNSGNSFYLTDFVINKNNSRRYDLFNETQSTLILYRKDNFIYIELQGTYSSAIVDLQSRNSQLNPEDVTDSVSTSSLQEIN